MSAENIFVSHKEVAFHTLILGTTGRGKSTMLKEIAKQRGVSYDELLRQIEPTEEQRQQEREMMQQRESKALARLNAVREAYWSMSDAYEFHNLSDALREYCGIEAPSSEQCKEVFFLLPERIVGAGIQWGFADSVVRDDICEYVRDNWQTILEKLNQA